MQCISQTPRWKHEVFLIRPQYLFSLSKSFNILSGFKSLYGLVIDIGQNLLIM
jgi:hypothetical protein